MAEYQFLCNATHTFFLLFLSTIQNMKFLLNYHFHCICNNVAILCISIDINNNICPGNIGSYTD